MKHLIEVIIHFSTQSMTKLIFLSIQFFLNVYKFQKKLNHFKQKWIKENLRIKSKTEIREHAIQCARKWFVKFRSSHPPACARIPFSSKANFSPIKKQISTIPTVQQTFFFNFSHTFYITNRKSISLNRRIMKHNSKMENFTEKK